LRLFWVKASPGRNGELAGTVNVRSSQKKPTSKQKWRD